ncbi:peptidoglycan-binding protein [Streptomyces sp. NPDC056486]|uniref:peptidoglycan-binding domain-containing protein n=1 Tax=Streptomyces sp. NPDC056486 TaxID=3345835 RepID=UPI0036924915
MSSAERRPNGADDERGGRLCPECGTSREQGGAPACGCTERAADAARDARSADAAAAEDFDPLRIRPYVTLSEPGPADGTEPEPAPSLPLPPETVASPQSADVGLFVAGGESAGSESEGGAAEDGPHLSPSSSPPSPPLPYDEEPEPRRVRIGLYAGVGAVAVVTVAVLAAVLLPPDKPQRDDQALPDVATRAVNAPSDSAGESTPTTDSAQSSARASSPSATSPSTSPKASPSLSPSHTASDKARPTRPPSRSTERATDSVKSDAPSGGTVLSQGDKGPEVEELQLRLQQLYLYMGEADGTYNAPVTDAVARFQFARGTQKDEKGVYGEETRAALEAETSEPRQHREPR